MAFLYENIQSGLFNFQIPCLDQTVPMLYGDTIKLLYALEGSGYPSVLKLVEEIPEDDDCLDNYCCPEDCRDMGSNNTVYFSSGDIQTEIQALITSTVTNMQTEIQTQVQADFDALSSEMSNIDVSDLYATIEPQINGDKHYDNGYDFFNDMSFKENTNQEYDDYYSFFYLETDIDSPRYVRSISTTDGIKHVRNAIGAYNYSFNSTLKKVVNYSKIDLPQPVTDVIELKFSNKDIVEYGFELTEDKQTILIFCDPEGFFLDKRVKVRYIA